MSRFFCRGFALWQKATLARIPGLNVQLIETRQYVLVNRFNGLVLKPSEKRYKIVNGWDCLLVFLQHCFETLLHTLLRPDPTNRIVGEEVLLE